MKINILIAATAVLILTGCNSAQLTQIASQTMGAGNTNSIVPPLEAKAAGTVNDKAGCIPRMGGGSSSWQQLVTEKLVTILIENALEDIAGNQEIQVPSKIMDTCIADARLKYLKTLTKDFSNVIDGANKDILDSLETSKEIQTLQAQMDHMNTTKENADFNDNLSDMTKNTFALAEKGKVKDKELYSKAMGKLAIATPITGYMIVGWDKEILEFAKDNMVWGVQNVSALKDVASQLSTTIQVLPTLASLATNPLYDGRVDKDIAELAGKDQEKSSSELEEIATADGGFEG